MTHAEHRRRHAALHEALDELIADYLAQTRGTPSTTTVMELLRWSADQVKNPTENRLRPSHLPVIEVDHGQS